MDKLGFTFFVAALMAAAPASAQVYKCVDAEGKTVYLQSPCPAGQSSKVISRQAPAEEAAAPKPGAKAPPTPEQAYQKRQKDREEADKKSGEQGAEAKRKQEECQRARQAAGQFESGARIASVDSKGERYYLDENQVARERARTQALVNEWCK
jgi:hypothetical protein